MMDFSSAKKAARKYCVHHGYNAKAIDELVPQTLSGKICFVYFPNKNSDGLTNDIETQGIPILTVDNDSVVAESDSARNVLEQGDSAWKSGR